MRRDTYHLIYSLLLASGLCFPLLSFAQATATTKHDHSTHQHEDICAGFVVLPNGYAVLSAMEPGSSSSGMEHGTHHDMANQKGMGHEPHAQHSGDMKPADPLMGHKHGEDIPTGKDMLCVPIGEPERTTWTSVSHAADLHVTANAVKGTLAHNSRANESLSFTIMRDGKPVGQADVQVFARMPHHDHRMPGGHGPANDPDVKGLEASPKGNGVYLLPMIDFSMGGAWLFEADVKEKGGTVNKAYFASEIGEE